MSLYTLKGLCEELKTDFSSTTDGISKLLTDAGLDDFSQYAAFYISRSDKSFCSVYPVEANHSDDMDSDSIMIKFQLPGVLEPMKYVDQIWDNYMEKLNPMKYGYISIDMTMVISYPGQWGGSGGGSNIEIQLDFIKENTRCDYN